MILIFFPLLKQSLSSHLKLVPKSMGEKNMPNKSLAQKNTPMNLANNMATKVILQLARDLVKFQFDNKLFPYCLTNKH